MDNVNAQDFYNVGTTPANITSAQVLTVFPNPANNNTTVVLNYMPVNKVFLDLVDFNGHIRRTFSFPPGTQQLSLDVSFLETGYYVLRIREGAMLIDIVKFVKG